MKKYFSFTILVLFGFLILIPTTLVADEAEIGKPAPAFTATDVNGQTQSISQYKGKVIVLEWINHGCPYVIRHYDSQNMPNLQKEAAEKGVIWLSICSSAEGKQGYETAEDAKATAKAKGSAAASIILDPEGTIGRKYGAKTTPHMYIINAEGILAYNGAIDDSPRGDAETAKNYVKQALSELLSGKDVSEKTSVPYGCSVKYK